VELFVCNIPFAWNSSDLQNLFAPYDPASAKVIKDKGTGKPKGFGFVSFYSDDDARTALETLNGQRADGRVLMVKEARPREARPRRLGLGRRYPSY
jgi:RNA recognition motif-containing protein